MGRSKALLAIDDLGGTFVSRIVSTLHEAGRDDVLVVIGPDTDSAAMDHAIGRTWPRVRLVVNQNAAHGQLSSLLAALEVADRPGVRGILVTLVDVPLVSVETVRAVVDAHEQSGAPIVRPAMDGRHGHPVIFDRVLFDELRAADPQLGAKAVVRRHAAAIQHVNVQDEGAFVDVDTPDEYLQWIGRSLDRPVRPDAE